MQVILKTIFFQRLIKLFSICLVCFLFASCDSSDSFNQTMVAYKMKQICAGQKKFFEINKRYGTLAELYAENLVTDDKRNHRRILENDFYGYVFEFNTNKNSYSVISKPLDYKNEGSASAPLFYIDEKSKNVKVLYSINIGSNLPDYKGNYDGEFSCE